MPVGILIVDDHAVVRDGLKMILETNEDFHVVGTAVNGREAISKFRELQPDVVLMDIAMPEMNGIEASRLINESFPDARIIILSMYHTHEHVFRALRAGVRGYLLKESAGYEVVAAIRSVMKGQRYLGKSIELPGELSGRKPVNRTKSPLESLSKRERQVLQHVVEGRTSAEIAATLSLSPKSVETYRSRLMIKLGISNVPALVKFALQHGITPEN